MHTHVSKYTYTKGYSGIFTLIICINTRTHIHALTYINLLYVYMHMYIHAHSLTYLHANIDFHTHIWIQKYTADGHMKGTRPYERTFTRIHELYLLVRKSVDMNICSYYDIQRENFWDNILLLVFSVFIFQTS